MSIRTERRRQHQTAGTLFGLPRCGSVAAIARAPPARPPRQQRCACLQRCRLPRRREAALVIRVRDTPARNETRRHAFMMFSERRQCCRPKTSRRPAQSLSVCHADRRGEEAPNRERRTMRNDVMLCRAASMPQMKPAIAYKAPAPFRSAVARGQNHHMAKSRRKRCHAPAHQRHYSR